MMRYFTFSDSLFNPEAARSLLNEIKLTVLSLSEMPSRFPVLDDEYFSRLGIRKASCKNYLIFYRIEEDSRTVSVLRVLYNRREWHNLLY